MNPVPPSKDVEIDTNLVRFLEILPDILAEHEGEYLLLRHAEVVAYFQTAMDAQISGNQEFADGLFSIQKVQNAEEELGYFSYALSAR